MIGLALPPRISPIDVWEPFMTAYLQKFNTVSFSCSDKKPTSSLTQSTFLSSASAMEYTLPSFPVTLSIEGSFFACEIILLSVPISGAWKIFLYALAVASFVDLLPVIIQYPKVSLLSTSFSIFDLGLRLMVLFEKWPA